MNKPNMWRVKYLSSTGKFEEYDRLEKRVDNLHNLHKLLYSLAQDKIISITPLYITEIEFGVLSNSEINNHYDKMHKDLEISRWSEQLARGNKIVENAVKELGKLQ